MYKTIRQSIDLALGGGELCWPDSLAVQGEADGHRWVVSVLDGGRPAALQGATAECYVINGGVTNRLDAAIEGSDVSAVFSAGCYAQSGELRAILRVYGADGAAPAVALLRLRVQEGMTDVISDPGHVIPSLKELLAQLDACRESARQADAAASAAGTAADEADEAASAAGTAAADCEAAAGEARAAAGEAATAVSDCARAVSDCASAVSDCARAASECARAASTADEAAKRVDALDVDGLTRACETAAQTALDAAGTVGDAIAGADTAAAGADEAARRAIDAIQGVENLNVDGLREACESAAQTALDAVSTVDEAIAQANAKADEAAAGARAAAGDASAAAEDARAAGASVDAAIATANDSVRAANDSARAASTAASAANDAASAANDAAGAATDTASAAAESARAAGAEATAAAATANEAASAANESASAANTAAAAATQAVEGLDVPALYAGYVPRNGLYDGADLKAVFGTAGALHAAVDAGDFSKIRVGDFWPLTLSGTFRDYASATSQTLSSVELVLEVAGINVYLNYGDQSVSQNHLVFCSRDLLPAELKYRSGADTWHSTSEKNPWRGSHLFQTLNNASNGILALMLKSDLGSYIYKGPNDAGMRVLGEVKPSGTASATNFEWMDRGRLFLPTEREVWGQDVFGDHTWGGGAAVQWPLFHGSLRHIIKTRADRRTGWWCQDSVADSPNNFTCVRTYGHPASYQSINPFSAPVCFLLV